MSEKKGFFAVLFGKTEEKEETAAVTLSRPDTEQVRPLHGGEVGCPFCGSIADASDEVCACCGKQQPWYFKII